MKAMSDLGVTVILDERLDLSTVDHSQQKGAERIVKTLKGREIAAELVVRIVPIDIVLSRYAHDYVPTRCFALAKFLTPHLSVRWTRASFDQTVALPV